MRTWIPLVILVVVIVGGFTVHRIRGFFGSENRPSYSDTNLENSKPFNPKHLTYEIFGPPGTVADISYFDVNSEPQRVDGAVLPWSLHITTNDAAVMGNIVAQGNSDTDRSWPTASSDGTNTVTTTQTASQPRMIGTAKAWIILAMNGFSGRALVLESFANLVLTRTSPSSKYRR